MKRKFSCLLLFASCLFLILAFSACGGGGDDGENPVPNIPGFPTSAAGLNAGTDSWGVEQITWDIYIYDTTLDFNNVKVELYAYDADGNSYMCDSGTIDANKRAHRNIKKSTVSVSLVSLKTLDEAYQETSENIASEYAVVNYPGKASLFYRK